MSEPLRFIHCADLHLDCPPGGVIDLPEEAAKKAKIATFGAFEKLVDTAISREVDFIVIAGDVFNSSQITLRAQYVFRDGMERLAAAGIEAYVAHGNHDPIGSWRKQIRLPSNVNVFPGDGVASYSFEKDGSEAARIYGISFPQRDVSKNLAAQFTRETNDVPAIAVLHCLVGSYTGHERYAPATKEDLLNSGFDYWALGHVHTMDIINKSHPAIVYPGNIQGLHRNETGERGCYLVNMDESRDCRLEFISLDCLRFETILVDVSGASTFDEIEDLILSACREPAWAVDSVITVRLSGRTSLNKQLRREADMLGLVEHIREMLEVESPMVWVESLRVQTASFHEIESLQGREDFVGDVLSIYERLENPESEMRKELRDSLDAVFAGWSGSVYMHEIEAGELSELIRDAKMRTLDELLEESDDAN